MDLLPNEDKNIVGFNLFRYLCSGGVVGVFTCLFIFYHVFFFFHFCLVTRIKPMSGIGTNSIQFQHILHGTVLFIRPYLNY